MSRSLWGASVRARILTRRAASFLALPGPIRSRSATGAVVCSDCSWLTSRVRSLMQERCAINSAANRLAGAAGAGRGESVCGEDLLGCQQRIDLIRLAAATVLAARALNLDHIKALGEQVLAEAGAVSCRHPRSRPRRPHQASAASPPARRSRAG